MIERKFAKDCRKWLRDHGAYVIVNRAGPGIPVGCPDTTFVFEDRWGVVEFKRSADAPYRPGQEATLARLKDWNPFVYTAYPENWAQIQKELLLLFF